MRISFIPQRRDDTLVLERIGRDQLSINDEVFDFSPLMDGDTLSAELVPCEWFSPFTNITRVSGEIHLTMILPHGPNPSQAVAFPEPINVTEYGPIAVPVVDKYTGDEE